MRLRNLPKEERGVIAYVRKSTMGYIIADENYGAVIHSKCSFKEQCLLHSENGKGTYNKTIERSRGEILEDIELNLGNQLIRFKEKISRLGKLVRERKPTRKKIIRERQEKRRKAWRQLGHHRWVLPSDNHHERNETGLV